MRLRMASVERSPATVRATVCSASGSKVVADIAHPAAGGNEISVDTGIPWCLLHKERGDMGSLAKRIYGMAAASSHGGWVEAVRKAIPR